MQPQTNTEQILQDALDFIKKKKENFFIWLHLMDTHWPFCFPAYTNPILKYKVLTTRTNYVDIPGKREYSNEAGELMNAMYDTSIKKLDAMLESLFHSLNKNGILESTYVFFTSDHGEEFLERGSFDHQENVYQEVAHVPLIIRRPRAKISLIRP